MAAAKPLVDDMSGYLYGWKLFIVITCLYFGVFLIAIDANIINAAIPKISADFQALNDVAWYGSAYLVALTALQPVYGSIYRYFNIDAVYKVAVIIFEVGSILCATAVNSPMFIIGRAIAGIGGAGIFQGALSIISQIVPLEKRALYQSIVLSVFAVTSTVGPILGGAFTEKATWRWCFWINLPIGALVLAGLTLFLKLGSISTEARRLPLKKKLSSLDPLGCIVFLAAICCLLLALQWGGQTKPWNSADVIGCLVGFIAILIVFIFLQWHRKEEAMIPLRIMKQRSIWTSSAVLFFLGANFYMNSFFIPFWFQAVLGLQPVQSGINIIALLIPVIVFMMLVGGMVKKYGHYVPPMLIGEVVAVGGQAMLTQLHPATSTAYWASALVITGIGAGLAQQLPYTAVAVVLSDADMPVGNAIAALFYQLGGSVGIAMGQAITFSALLDQIPQRLPNLSPHDVLNAGATNLEGLAKTPEELTALREIWNTGLVREMILCTVVVALAVPFTLGTEWLNAVKVGEQRRQVSTITAVGGTDGNQETVVDKDTSDN